MCGFISTSDDKFVLSLDGAHTFDEIEEHPMGERMKAIVPRDFFLPRSDGAGAS